jgi:hypothetical protein
VKIFGLDDAGKERIFGSYNIPSSISNKTFVDSVEVSNAKTPLSLDWQISSQEHKAIGLVRLSS